MADLSKKLAKASPTAVPKKKVADTFTTATDKPTRTTVYLPPVSSASSTLPSRRRAVSLRSLRPGGKLAGKEGDVSMSLCLNI